MQFTDKLTIAIPVFERQEYFEQALDSAVNQSIKCKVVVVDNASSHDNFERICALKNVKYYRNEHNIGMFPNWNKCFEHARTEFVMLLGDDDILDKDYVKCFVKALDNYSDIDVFYSNFELYSHADGEIIKHSHTIPFGFNTGNVILEYGIEYGLGFPVISSAIRKSIFKGFYIEEHGSNDWHWIYKNASALKFYGNDNTLLKYGRHELQDTKNVTTHIKCVLSIAYIYESILFPEVKNSSFKELAVQRGKSWFYYFLAMADEKYLNSLNQEEHIYANYLRDKIKQNRWYYLIIKLPKSIRGIGYRSLRKLKMIDSFSSKS